MLSIPHKCPICNADTYVEQVRCKSCQTAITNKFEISKFDKLTDEQVEFVLAFVGVDGNIREMEKVLGVSYPTVKSRLSEIQLALGLKGKCKATKQMEVLEQIERGEITVEEAMEFLNKEKF